jgi:hypothetical protein
MLPSHNRIVIVDRHVQVSANWARVCNIAEVLDRCHTRLHVDFRTSNYRSVPSDGQIHPIICEISLELVVQWDRLAGEPIVLLWPNLDCVPRHLVGMLVLPLYTRSAKEEQSKEP